MSVWNRSFLPPLLVCLAAAVCVEAAHADDVDYLRQIQELVRSGPQIAAEEGKEALIARYQALIDSNPGASKNIELAIRIGQILNWEVQETGETSDPEAALAWYLSVMETYDPANPHMKYLKRLAAKQAEPIEPETAKSLYEEIIQDYPDDGFLQMGSYGNLAKLARATGDIEAAEAYYEQVLDYDTAGMETTATDANMADSLRQTAFVGLFSMALDEAKTSAEQKEALEALLAKYPYLARMYPELVQRFRLAIETSTPISLDASDAGAVDTDFAPSIQQEHAKPTPARSGKSVFGSRAVKKEPKRVSNVDELGEATDEVVEEPGGAPWFVPVLVAGGFLIGVYLFVRSRSR